MDLSPYGVRATSGSLRLTSGQHFPHAWTTDGVITTPVANGAQALHLSVALCVLNDLWRESQQRGLLLSGVTVTADGGFDDAWRSTGITYDVDLATEAAPDDVAALLTAVDVVAEMPRALRAGAAVSPR